MRRKTREGFVTFVPRRPPTPHPCHPPSTLFRSYDVGTTWRCRCGQLWRFKDDPRASWLGKKHHWVQGIVEPAE